MARRMKKPVRSTRRGRVTLVRSRWPTLWTVIMLLGLLLGIVVSMVTVSRSTEMRKQASKCSLASCNQCQSNGYWIINNLTNCPAEPDGDQQYCDRAGRVGLCGGHQWCCAAAGQKWTTNMTPCAGHSYNGSCIAPSTPTASPIPTNSPTNTPVPTNVPNTPIPTPIPTSSDTPTPIPTYYYYYSPTPYYTPTDTPLPTPTPTFYILASCNKTCVNNLDCPGGLICVPTSTGAKGCRNAFCSSQQSCLCGDESTGWNLAVVPTVIEPNPYGSSPQIRLTVSSFTDKNGNTNDRPYICGMTAPGAKVTVSIFPDGVSGDVTADSSGKWCWRPMKPLSAGKKSLLVVAKNADGQGEVAQTFTVIATTGGISIGWLLFILLLLCAGGGYVYYKSKNS